MLYTYVIDDPDFKVSSLPEDNIEAFSVWLSPIYADLFFQIFFCESESAQKEWAIQEALDGFKQLIKAFNSFYESFFNRLEFDVRIAVFWTLDDLFSYLASSLLFSIKCSINYIYYVFNFNLIIFFLDHQWYEKVLSGSPKEITTDVFSTSVFMDLTNFVKSITSRIHISVDIMPVTGMMYPYYMEHPEILTCLAKYENYYFIDLASTLMQAYLNSRLYYVVDTIFVFGVNLAMLFVLWIYLKAIFLSYIFNFYKDEGSTDTDQAVSSLVVESEKEISGIDDLMIIMLVVFFVFGVYFLFYGLSLLMSYTNNFVCIYILFPILFLFIYVAPACLLFDFGVYSFVYLRGSGPTAMLSAELLYDLINLFAFFIRVFIQLARILLMLIAAGSLQEFIFYFGIDYKFLICNDFFLDTIYNLEFNTKSLTLFFFTKFPAFLLYWAYEIFHTYFVVTIQTIAFFAMVFWLFFYLFTFFFSEKHENYFNRRRAVYKRILLNIKYSK